MLPKTRNSPEPVPRAKGWGLALYSAVGKEVVFRGAENPDLVGRSGRVVGVDGDRLRVKFRLPSGEEPVIHVPPEDLGIRSEADFL